MTYREQVENANEVWQDGEGCLYCPDLEGTGWYAFGHYDSIPENNILVVKPLTKVVDGEGNILVSKLNYKIKTEEK